MVTHTAMHGIPRPQQRPEAPASAVFGDLARKYSAEAGTFPGEAGKLVRDADVILSQVSGRCRDSLGEAARIAGDKTIAAEGRRELIGQLSAGVTEDAAGKLSRAEFMLKAAHAELTVQALPVVSEKDAMVARADAEMVLRNVPARELPTRMAELAKREDAVGAIVASSWGSDYLASRGESPALHEGVRQHAIAAAAESGDPQRAAAAEALGRLHHMEGAVIAAHQQVRHLREDDLKRIRGAVADPLAAENARLEQVIASQRHQPGGFNAE